MPEAADPIPGAVLASPLIGELRRFDGAAAPTGWMAADGRTLSVAGNPQLFSVLKTVAGGDGTTTFLLPKPPFGAIIAVAGMLATSPSVLTSSARRVSASASLGPGTTARPPRTARQPSAKAAADLAAQRRLLTSGVRLSRGTAQVSPELANRYRAAREDARVSALAVLGPNSRARLDAAVAAAVSGQTSVYGAVTAMISTLTRPEAEALLGVNDAMVAPFNGGAAGRSNVQDDAAHFLISVAITPAQARTIFERERSRL